MRSFFAVLRKPATADVVVHNFRAGVMEKLGLGYEHLAATHQRLVYASSGGWGDHGPSADRARCGHDLMARAEAGWFTQPDPAKPPFPASMSADYPAGLMLMQGILLALLARVRTGRGPRVTTGLLSVAFHAHSWEGPAAMNQMVRKSLWLLGRRCALAGGARMSSSPVRHRRSARAIAKRLEYRRRTQCSASRRDAGDRDG